MRLVASCPVKPGRCAVLPQLGGTHRDGYVDSGSEMLGGGDGSHDQRVYVSVVAVRQLAGLIGWADPSGLQEELATARADLEQALADLARATAHLDAIDVLESEGFQRRRRPGRPKKAEEEVMAGG